MKHCPNCGKPMVMSFYSGLCQTCATEKLRLEKRAIEFYTREDRPRPSVTQVLENINAFVERNMQRFQS